MEENFKAIKRITFSNSCSILSIYQKLTIQTFLTEVSQWSGLFQQNFILLFAFMDGCSVSHGEEIKQNRVA